MQKGFTLIELAIVIVVVGILVLGVVGARSIMESVKVSSQVRQINQFKTSILAFEMEFGAIPGDLGDAYDYFGHDCGANNNSAVDGCNGYGNKCLDFSNCQVNAAYYGDIKRFAVHLVFSKIMSDLNWVRNVNSNSQCNGENGGVFIGSELDGGILIPNSQSRQNKVYLNILSSNTWSHNGAVCSSFDYGVNSYITSGNVLKKIDTKFDDGNGLRGYIRALRDPRNSALYALECIDSQGNYVLGSENPNCSFRVELK